MNNNISTTKLCILVFLGLAYCLFIKHKKEIKEGITNMNCCGGILLGTHFQDSDIEPPSYVNRCFSSSRENGQIRYNWSANGCTENGTEDCCGGEGTCMPSKRGGYCLNEDNGETFIFNRGGGSRKTNFIRRGGDDDLDINDTNQMREFLEERGDSLVSDRSLAQQEAQDRENRALVTGIIQNNLANDLSITKRNLELLNEQKKENQIISWITIIHVSFILAFSIVLKEPIIAIIDGYYDKLNLMISEFKGQTA